MKVFKELEKIPNLSIALGYFDGVHKGHQSVIKSAVDYAKTNNTKSAVITFTDHPSCYFYKLCPKYILTKEAREEHIKKLGIDYIFELDFESISGLTADDYLKEVLVNHFMPSAICTGWNHNFGYNQSGNSKFLASNAKKYGYEYFELPPQKDSIHTISSTAIRDFLFEGDIKRANSMLGYNFAINGTVIEGQKLGRQIGFRTANINYPRELVDIPFGVYSVIVKIENDGNFYRGIANFGIKPTVSDEQKHSLETHILDFDRDIYGKNIQVEFLKMIRQEKKFPSLDALKTQINNDIKSI